VQGAGGCTERGQAAEVVDANRENTEQLLDGPLQPLQTSRLGLQAVVPAFNRPDVVPHCREFTIENVEREFQVLELRKRHINLLYDLWDCRRGI
jgi:hypothetical protein